MRRVEACAKPFCGFARICGRVLCVHRSGSFHTRRCRNDASRVASERMVVPTRTRTLGDEQRDAGQDYLESDSEASGICLRHGAARGADRRPRGDGRHRAASPQSARGAPAVASPGSVYDRLAPRRFEFVPLWGLRVFFLYMMRRVDVRAVG